MKAFQFRLQRVLNWRRQQLELIEVKIERIHAELDSVDSARSRLRESLLECERQVREPGVLVGSELAALAGYQLFVKKRQAALLEQRKQYEDRLTEERRRLQEARRRVQLIEKLRERRLAEWKMEAAKEMETLAGELSVAAYVRNPREPWARLDDSKET